MEHIKHLTKDVYLECEGDYSFLLKRKVVSKGEKSKGKVRFEIISYHSNMEMVLKKLKDLGYMEWVNGDLDSCRDFINEACESLQV